MIPDLIELSLWVSAAYLLAGCALAVFMNLRASRVAGTPVRRAHPGRRKRIGAALALALVALALALALDAEYKPLVVCVLALGLLLGVLVPGPEDMLCGESGVRRSWYARGHDELEEWRLVGQHLRFRLFGEWTAVELPPEEHERFRTKLRSLNAERESRFQA